MRRDTNERCHTNYNTKITILPRLIETKVFRSDQWACLAKDLALNNFIFSRDRSLGRG